MPETASNPFTGEHSRSLAPQPSAAAVYEEHIRALNAAEWEGQLQQFPDHGEIHLKNGQVLRGRQAISDFIAGGVRPRSAGGVEGLTFTEQSRLTVGDTVVVHWVADADWLAEPDQGSDAYVTDGQYMVAMVTTFDPEGLVFED
ncbi:MAG: nuclear transport factor 2 family protein [Acidimicrobiia bacterium]|nr:nuclear transport factor 2 family protein [Acidimicrobiia bacterium]